MRLFGSEASGFVVQFAAQWHMEAATFLGLLVVSSPMRQTGRRRPCRRGRELRVLLDLMAISGHS